MGITCTNCGASLSADGSSQTVNCEYCHRQTFVPEAIWLRFHPPVAAPPAISPAPPSPSRGNLGLAVGIGAAVIAAIAVFASVGILAGRKGSTPRPFASASKGSTRSPIASAREPCDGRQAACSKDGKAELQCGADHAMVVVSTCKGPGGCRASADGQRITCDTTYADPNDPCETADSGCSTDRKAELHCVAGHSVVISTCKGPDGCTLTPSGKGEGYVLSCDDHLADVGDPCFGSDRIACSSDKKALLTCTAQRFAVERTCKKGCVTKKVVGTDKTTMDCE